MKSTGGVLLEPNEQLKELSFQMMLNEMMKKQIENSFFFGKITGNNASIYSTPQGYWRGIMESDKKGYELSLTFNELLLQTGYNHNAFANGPDAANISAENLLYQYGLKYPISWYVVRQDSEGLHFEYYDSKRIDSNHLAYLKEVEELLKSGRIDQNVHERLVAAGEYYAAHHKLLSKYHNHEDLEKAPTI